MGTWSDSTRWPRPYGAKGAYERRYATSRVGKKEQGEGSSAWRPAVLLHFLLAYMGVTLPSSTVVCLERAMALWARGIRVAKPVNEADTSFAHPVAEVLGKYRQA